MQEASIYCQHEPLTPSRIANVGPVSKTLWLCDDNGVKGFGRLLLRISPGNNRLWYFRQEFNGVRKTTPIGPYSLTRQAGFFTLNEARDVAASLRQLRINAWQSPTSGNPQSSAEVPTQAQAPVTTALPQPLSEPLLSVLQVCDLYLQNLRLLKKQSVKDFESVIKVHIAPSPVANLPAKDVPTEQFADLIRSVLEQGKIRTAIKVRQILHAAYQQAISVKVNPKIPNQFKRGGISVNPISAIDTMNDLKNEGERNLSIFETKALWRRLYQEDNYDLPIQFRVVRLTFLLGGQRCIQLLRAKRTDVDLENGTILLRDPKGLRTKARPHGLPLVDAALAEVKFLLDYGSYHQSEYLFPGNKPGTSLSEGTVSKCVHDLSIELLNSSDEKNRILEGFCYGDIRRTIETIFSSFRVPEKLCGYIQSHGLTGVQIKHYNKYQYLKEKREVLENWEALLFAPEGAALPASFVSARTESIFER